MSATKIVIIGAGSASFGLPTLATTIHEPALRGSELVLVDHNEEILESLFEAALRMNREWGAQMSILANTSWRPALSGAEFVTASIETAPREKLWQLDWEIPLKHGLRQTYAENGGPGGMMHACRQIPIFMEIARDMEELCPDAWLINFSNPLPRITRAVTKYSKIKTVGKCHQVKVGYGIAAGLLYPEEARETGLADERMTDLWYEPNAELIALGRERFEIVSAGLNHFIWLLEIRDKLTGEDLYPALRKAAESAEPAFYPLTMELFQIFGLCPIAGDAHLSEYLPWLHDATARPWEKYGIPLYKWTRGEERRLERAKRVREVASGIRTLNGLSDYHSEGAMEIIRAITDNLVYHDEAVNIPNRGKISNLRMETIIEIPAVIDSGGINGIEIGNFPEPIVELMRREAALVEMVVETAISGDRELALQTLLLDPMIGDIAQARDILDDYLRIQSPYLPQF